MKKLSFALLFAVLSVGFIECDEVRQSAPSALAKNTDGGVEMVAPSETLAGLFGSTETVYKQGRAVEHVIDYASFTVEGEQDYFYAVAKGTDSEGQCFTKSIPLRVTSDGLIGPLGEGLDAAKEPGDTHACTGAPYSDCDFTRNGEGEIQGCECSDGPVNGFCNHTITSG